MSTADYIAVQDCKFERYAGRYGHSNKRGPLALTDTASSPSLSSPA
jgi:hypothetical protein